MPILMVNTQVKSSLIDFIRNYTHIQIALRNINPTGVLGIHLPAHLSQKMFPDNPLANQPSSTFCVTTSIHCVMVYYLLRNTRFSLIFLSFRFGMQRVCITRQYQISLDVYTSKITYTSLIV